MRSTADLRRRVPITPLARFASARWWAAFHSTLSARQDGRHPWAAVEHARRPSEWPRHRLTAGEAYSWDGGLGRLT